MYSYKKKEYVFDCYAEKEGDEKICIITVHVEEGRIPHNEIKRTSGFKSPIMPSGSKIMNARSSLELCVHDLNTNTNLIKTTISLHDFKRMIEEFKVD